MKINLKALLVAAIVLMAVLPGVYGMSFGATYGDSQGNRATAFATLSNAQNLQQSITGSPGTAAAGIFFSLDSADYINAGARAVDTHQNTASVGLVVNKAGPTSYANMAGVNIMGPGPMAVQYFRTGIDSKKPPTISPSGTISTTASASDQNGNRASASTVVTNGVVPLFISEAVVMPSQGIKAGAFEIAPDGLAGDTINSRSTAIDQNDAKATSSTVINSPFTAWTTDATGFYENAAGITNNLYTEYPNEKWAAQLWGGVVGENILLRSSATNQNGNTKRCSPDPITSSTPTDLTSYGLLTSGVPSAFSGLYDGSALPFPFVG